ncbi:MAG: type II toxin-antitoxin system HicA family toxin [Candidatus Omnitrophota bacterium]
MTQWSSSKERQVLAALLRIGWSIKREARGSHRVLQRSGWPDYVFAFHDHDEIGPRMLGRISKHTGLKPDDL